MPLSPGTTLGPYAVTAKIGEGGMGEVYRARDTKPKRHVALPGPGGRSQCWLFVAVVCLFVLPTGAPTAEWRPDEPPDERKLLDPWTRTIRRARRIGQGPLVLRPGQLCSNYRDEAIATFEDANLEAAIRRDLTVGAEEDLTCGLIVTLTSLEVTTGITSLVGIQNLTSLTVLNLNGTSVTDIGPLRELTNLTELGLANNPSLTDIQPVLDNTGIRAGDAVSLANTNVSCLDTAALAARGVRVTCMRRVPLPDEPVVFTTLEQPQIRVAIVTNGLSQPWGLAFLPAGDILVTEKAGRLRVIRAGVLDPDPIPGVPEVLHSWGTGLMDIALHPRFVENSLIYLTYTKPGEDGATVALARGRFDGAALRDVHDIFVADPWGATFGAGSRIVFAADGTLYMTLGGAFFERRSVAQDPSAHAGKVLRLRDDGTVPDDNPFVERAGFEPEIFSFGHRNPQGAAVHPETGALWASEHGPQGGDEVNVIVAGRNYGWPESSYGREYTGPRVSVQQPWQAGMAHPVIVWVPSIAPTGMTFYTGDRFPAWRGNLFVGGLQTGGIPGTGHVERIVLNSDGEELRREWLLTELKQRIRDVRQGPDGLLYVLTAEDEAALLRIEPVRPN